jgi:hypothetical protein
MVNGQSGSIVDLLPFGMKFKIFCLLLFDNLSIKVLFWQVKRFLLMFEDYSVLSKFIIIHVSYLINYWYRYELILSKRNWILVEHFSYPRFLIDISNNKLNITWEQIKYRAYITKSSWVWQTEIKFVVLWTFLFPNRCQEQKNFWK